MKTDTYCNLIDIALTEDEIENLSQDTSSEEEVGNE